jgi:hypothetical protein
MSDSNLTPQLRPFIGHATRAQAVDDLETALRADGVIVIALAGMVPLCARLLSAQEDELHHWMAFIDAAPGEDLATANRVSPLIAQEAELNRGALVLVAMQRPDADQFADYASVPRPGTDERALIFTRSAKPKYPGLFLDALERVDPDHARRLRDLGKPEAEPNGE